MGELIPFPVWKIPFLVDMGKNFFFIGLEVGEIIQFPVLKINCVLLRVYEECNTCFLIRGLEVEEIIPYPVWIIPFPVLNSLFNMGKMM